MTLAGGNRGPKPHTLAPPIEPRPEPVFWWWRMRVVGCLWQCLWRMRANYSGGPDR